MTAQCFTIIIIFRRCLLPVPPVSSSHRRRRPFPSSPARPHHPPHMMLVFSRFSPKKVGPFEDSTEAVVVLAVRVDGRPAGVVGWGDGGWRGGRWCPGRGCLPSGDGEGGTSRRETPCSVESSPSTISVDHHHDKATGARTGPRVEPGLLVVVVASRYRDDDNRLPGRRG